VLLTCVIVSKLLFSLDFRVYLLKHRGGHNFHPIKSFVRSHFKVGLYLYRAIFVTYSGCSVVPNVTS